MPSDNSPELPVDAHLARFAGAQARALQTTRERGSQRRCPAPSR